MPTGAMVGLEPAVGLLIFLIIPPQVAHEQRHTYKLNACPRSLPQLTAEHSLMKHEPACRWSTTGGASWQSSLDLCSGVSGTQTWSTTSARSRQAAASRCPTACTAPLPAWNAALWTTLPPPLVGSLTHSPSSMLAQCVCDTSNSKAGLLHAGLHFWVYSTILNPKSMPQTGPACLARSPVDYTANPPLMRIGYSLWAGNLLPVSRVGLVKPAHCTICRQSYGSVQVFADVLARSAA